MKWIRYSTNVLATLVLGVFLSRWIDGLPYEFPPLPASIAFVMRRFGVDQITHADDIETIGLLVIIAVSMIISGVFVWIVNVVLRRRLSAQSGRRV